LIRSRLVRTMLPLLIAAGPGAVSAGKAPPLPPPATCPRVPAELAAGFTTAHLRVGDVVPIVLLPSLPVGSPADARLTPAGPDALRGTLRVTEMTGRRTSNRSAAVTFAIEPIAVGTTVVQLQSREGAPFMRLYGARNGIPSLYTYLPYVGTPASVYDTFHRGKEIAYAAGSTFFFFDRSADGRTCLEMPSIPAGAPSVPAAPPSVSFAPSGWAATR